jgi:hypothetical protein
MQSIFNVSRVFLTHVLREMDVVQGAASIATGCCGELSQLRNASIATASTSAGCATLKNTRQVLNTVR